MKTSRVVVISAAIGILLGVVSAAADLDWLGGGNSLSSLMVEARSGPRPALPPVTGPQAKAIVDSETHEFGVMQVGGSGSHDFIFTNRGDVPLELTLGGTTCQCTVGKLGSDTIPPGESTKVTLRWESKGGAGPFRQSATIWTNDPERRRVTLTVLGRAADPLAVTPQDVIFSSVRAGDEAVAEVRLTSMVEENLEVLAHEFQNRTTADLFEVDVEPIPRDQLGDPLAKSGVLVTIRVKPGSTVGSIEQNLMLSTNARGVSSVWIPIRGRVVGDLSLVGRGWNAAQSIWEVGSVKASEGARVELTIFVRGEDVAATDFEVVSAMPDVLRVSFGEQTQIKGGSIAKVPITLEIPRGSRSMARLGPAERDLGQIVIETNKGVAKQLRLFVRFSIEP